MKQSNFLYFLFLTFSLLLSNVPASASDIEYIKSVDAQTQAQLITQGDKLLRGLYQNQDLSQFNVLPLLVKGQASKNILSRLKKADLSILGKKSNATEDEKAVRREQLAQIIAMMWKVYDMGRKQGEDAVESSSYKVIDPQGKLYNFLKNYVTFANKQASVFAYDRDPKKNKSSHYKNVSPEGQWGIDVRFYANQSSLGLLPHERIHCLFGRLSIDPNQPNLLFIKFETQGTAAPSEIIGHGISYLKSQLRTASQKANTRIEKTIRPEIVQKYLSLVAQLSPQEQAKFKTNDAETVKEMLLTAKAIAEALPKFKGAQEDLVKTVQTIYPNDQDNIWYRTGNEIIIDMRRL